MIDQIFSDPENFARILVFAIAAGTFIYIIILAILQVRQIFLLQKKVQTSADGVVRILTFIYLAVQVALFVIALLFL